MELTPSSRFQWGDLMRPGPIILLLGLLILGGSLLLHIFFSGDATDPELTNSTAKTLKHMVGMVTGVGLVLFGALLSFLDFTKR